MVSREWTFPDGRRVEILQPEEIERIERDYAKGVPVRVIVDIFRPRGVRLSEATFRKYVQSGLLPRSRRVGKKGKHRGSQGLYPVEAVRRLNAIKKMMAEGHTLEDIKRSFLVFKSHIDLVERELLGVLDGFEVVLAERGAGDRARRELETRLRALRVQTRELLQAVVRFGSAVTARRSDEVQPDV